MSWRIGCDLLPRSRAPVRTARRIPAGCLAHLSSRKQIAPIAANPHHTRVVIFRKTVDGYGVRVGGRFRSAASDDDFACFGAVGKRPNAHTDCKQCGTVTAQQPRRWAGTLGGTRSQRTCNRQTGAVTAAERQEATGAEGLTDAETVTYMASAASDFEQVAVARWASIGRRMAWQSSRRTVPGSRFCR